MLETQLSEKTEITELLIVKAGADYIRFTLDGFERCSMNKGSVFPLSKIEDVKRKCAALGGVVSNIQLVKLSICEEPYRGEGL